MSAVENIRQNYRRKYYAFFFKSHNF